MPGVDLDVALKAIFEGYSKKFRKDVEDCFLSENPMVLFACFSSDESRQKLMELLCRGKAYTVNVERANTIVKDCRDKAKQYDQLPDGKYFSDMQCDPKEHSVMKRFWNNH